MEEQTTSLSVENEYLWSSVYCGWFCIAVVLFVFCVDIPFASAGTKRRKLNSQQAKARINIRRILRKKMILSVFGAKGKGSDPLLNILRSQKVLDRALGLSNHSLDRRSGQSSFLASTKFVRPLKYHLSVQNLVIFGLVDREQLEKYLHRMLPNLVSCLKRHMKRRQRGFSGIASLRWGILPDGRSSDVLPLQMTAHKASPDAYECIVRYTQKYLFPKPKEGAAVTVQIKWRWILR